MIEVNAPVIYYTLLFRLYIIDIAYEYNSTSSFENGYIYIHCQWITFSPVTVVVSVKRQRRRSPPSRSSPFVVRL